MFFSLPTNKIMVILNCIKLFERKMTMKHKHVYLKKTFSVILSFLLVFGTFCFFNPFTVTEANAATAGSYNVRLEIDSGNDTGGWNYGRVTLKGKSNNGTGAESNIFYGGDHKVNFNGKRNWYDGTTDKFPTTFSYEYSFGGGFTWREMKFTVRIYVNGVEVASQYHSAKSSAFSTAKGTKTTTVDGSKYPKVDKITIGGSNMTATVPTGSSVVSKTTSPATVYDQYGVQWYQEPEGYIISSSSGATSNDGSLTGITCTASSSKDTATVKITNAAKDWVANNGNNYQRTVYVRAYRNGKYSGAKSITITNCKVSGEFFNYNDTAKNWSDSVQKKDYYYNYSRVSAPTLTKTGWIFNGWSTPTESSGVSAVSSKIMVNTKWFAQWTKTVTGRFHYFNEAGVAEFKDSSKPLSTTETQFTASAPSEAPSTITYDGRVFKFLGWRADTAASTANTTDFTIPANYNNDVNTVKNFYAVYSGDINFGFDGNGGSVSGANKKQTQYLNASGSISSHTFDLTGVTASLADTNFAGWAETEDANDALAANKTFTITSDKTVYAVYKCNVRFLNEGKVFGTAVVTRNHNAVDPSPLPGTAPLSRPLKAFDDENEYFFTGWDRPLTITVHTDINAVFKAVEHTYVAIDTHEYPAVKVTCTSDGKQSYECSHERDDNGEVCHYIKTEVIKTEGHKWNIKDGKAATCTEKGYTDDIRCGICGFVKQESTEIPALGHDWGEFVETESDCKTNGLHVRYCKRCGVEDLETKVVKPLDSTKHKEIVIPGKAATCTENGMTEYTVCSVCGAILKAGSTIISEGHDWVVVEGEEAVAPTCTTDGRTAHIVCGRAGCNAEKQKSKVIPATGHNYIEVEAKEPTCTEPGNTPGFYCTKCGDGNVTFIDALGHDFEDIKVTKEATCTEEGLKEGGCKRCGEGHVEEIIPKLPHTPEVIPAVEATCSSFGYTEGEKCSVCGTVTVEPQKIKKLDHTWEKTDDGKPATCTEIGVTASYKCSVCGVTKGGEEIKKLGHSYGEVVITKKASCGVAGEKLLRCGNCGDTKTEIIPALTHSFVTVDAVEPTCTAAGSTAGVRCEICGEWSTEPETVAASGHAFGDELTLAATCTAEGKRYKVCAVCGEEEIIEILAKTGHVEEEIPAIEATCTKYGKTAGIKCAVCGEILKAPENVEPKEHTVIVDIEAKAATCAAGGNTEGTKCADCGKIIVKARNISAIEHKFSAWTVTVPATCTSKGIKERHCTEPGCTYSETEYTPAPGHSYGDWVTVVEPSCEGEGTKRCICRRCGDVIDQAVPALGHSRVTVAAVPATCEINGIGEGVKCSVCGVELEGFEVLPAIGHDYEVTHIDGDCEHDSYDLYVCKHDSTHTYKTNIDAAPGHVGGTATCTQKAVCDVCGHEYGDFAPHSYEATVTPPTCTADGYTTYVCSVCGDEYKSDIVPATGEHTYNDGIVTKTPTCTEDGEKIVACIYCGRTETVVVPAKGHSVSEWTVEGSEAKGTCSECGETVTRPATSDDIKPCDRCGYRHTRSTGLFKYKGVFCSITYFFRQIIKFFKGGK